MHIDVPSRPATDLEVLDNTALAESCVRILGLCLSEQPRTSGQLQARDDLVGYLVNTTLLSRVERLIIWGAQALGATMQSMHVSASHHGHASKNGTNSQKPKLYSCFIH